ncbi:MAG: DUF502 domain-containing protein [Planctomycetota bacterium]
MAEARGAKKKGLGTRLRRYLVAGLLAAIPLWVTWLIVSFLVRVLRDAGRPLVRALERALRPSWPHLADGLTGPAGQTVAAVVLVFALLVGLGWLTTMVLGRRLLKLVDDLIERVPMVQAIYGAAKKLLAAFQQKPDKVQRVVLVDFPSPEMKAVGLVTRTLVDADTGRELAAVYVPTTPNPTSGYLEIVPLDKVVSTTMTFEEAMTFIVSGGAVAPERMNYAKSARPL